MISWIVQSNLIKEELQDGIRMSCDRFGYNYVPLKIIPFTDGTEWSADLFFEPPKGQLAFYGSTSFIKMVAKSKWNKDGFFFNQDNLKTSKWVKELGTRMLNHDSKFMTLKEAMETMDDQLYFMKPDNDLKDFSGSDVNKEGIEKFYDSVSAGGFLFGTDIPVVLSPMKHIGWEYRCFMLNDKVIASSSYKLKSMMFQTKRVPESVIEFAEETAKIWHPDTAYTLDVCETDQGLKVVEFNCFNASGFYNCSPEKIVKAVSDHIMVKWPIRTIKHA